MADTYDQKCGIETSPNPIEQFFQEGGDENQTPPEIPCSRDNWKIKSARQSIFST